MSAFAEDHRTLGKVDSAYFGIEDHGILSMNVDLNFGGYGQGTGYFNLQNPNGWKFVKAMLEFFGVSEWSQIKGHTIYALYDTAGYNGMIRGLERTPFEGGKRIIFQEFFDA